MLRRPSVVPLGLYVGDVLCLCESGWILEQRCHIENIKRCNNLGWTKSDSDGRHVNCMARHWSGQDRLVLNLMPSTLPCHCSRTAGQTDRQTDGRRSRFVLARTGAWTPPRKQTRRSLVATLLTRRRSGKDKPFSEGRDWCGGLFSHAEMVSNFKQTPGNKSNLPAVEAKRKATKKRTQFAFLSLSLSAAHVQTTASAGLLPILRSRFFPPL